jgi:hypothetical protein
MTITIILLAISLRQGKAAEISYTITGVLTGGWDRIGIFFTGKEAQSMGGKPFTLVFTFDDSKRKPDSSGISGEGANSGAKAVLTIGGVSFTFGGERFSSWSVYRAPAFIGMSLNEAKGSLFDFASAVDSRIMPQGPPFPPDWRSPLSRTDIDNQPSCFFIRGKGTEAKGCFDIRKVEVTKR